MSKHESSTAKLTASAPAELLARCQAAAAASADSEELMELTMQLLAQELIARKLQGELISDNLKLVDRLMRYESLKLRRINARLRERKAQPKPAASPARSQESSSPSPTPPKESIRQAAYPDYPPAEKAVGKEADTRFDAKLVPVPSHG